MDRNYLILIIGNGLIVAHNTQSDQITKKDNLGSVSLVSLLIHSNKDELTLTDPVADFSLVVPYGAVVRVEDPKGNEITGLSTIVLLRAFMERMRAINRLPKGIVDFNLTDPTTRTYSGGNENDEDGPQPGYMGFLVNVTANTNLGGVQSPVSSEYETMFISNIGSGGFYIDVKDEAGSNELENIFYLPAGFGDDLDDNSIGIFQYDYVKEGWKILNNY